MVLIVFLLFFITSCSVTNEKTEEDKGLINITVNPECIKPINPLSDFVESIKYVYLETPPNLPIGTLMEFRVTEDMYYLRSGRMSSSIYAFDHTKKLKYCLQNDGKGPGEYNYVKSIFTDIDKNLYTYDVGNLKVIMYDSLGNFVNEWKHNSYGKQMVKYQNYFVLYDGYGGDYIEANNAFNLLFIDQEHNLYREYFTYDNQLNKFVRYGNMLTFTFYKQNLFFNQFLGDTIYQITPDQIFPRYFIDFGKHKITKKDYENGSFQHVGEFSHALRKKGRAFWIRHVLITDRHLFFMYVYKKNEVFVIYDKKHQNIIQTKQYINDIDFINWNIKPIERPLAVLENNIYSFIEPVDFILSIKNLKSRLSSTAWKEYVEQHQNIINIYNKVDKNSNPILRICTLNK